MNRGLMRSLDLLFDASSFVLRWAWKIAVTIPTDAANRCEIKALKHKENGEISLYYFWMFAFWGCAIPPLAIVLYIISSSSYSQ